MLRTSVALLVTAWISACATPPEPAKAAATSEPAKVEPAKVEPAKVQPKADPVVLTVCAAFDEVVAEGHADMPLSRAAVRATEKGLGEDQLAELGAMPAELAASIRKRGNPPQCAAMLAFLDRQG
ncbi:MAG: hypothetical protein JNK45_04030 [Myxococcales bacterium]|nr:hypothetical protein [Myxococcales bacterium]